MVPRSTAASQLNYLFCKLKVMGGNSSKSSVQQTNDFFNSVTNSFVSENSQKVSASQLNINKLNFQGASFKGCRVAIRQAIDSDTIATGQMTSQNIQDLTQKLKDSASSAIDNAASQKNGFLASGVANDTSATTNVKNTVTNIIQNTMSSKSVQDIFASASNKNDADFSGLTYECDPQFKSVGKCSADDSTGCDLVVDQNIKSKLVAKGVADAITKALSNVITDNTTSANVAQTSTQTNAGVSEAISAWFQGVGGIAAIIACVVCVLIVGLVIFLLSPAGQSATTSIADAGASRLKGPLPI
jgi:hypothetical protein